MVKNSPHGIGASGFAREIGTLIPYLEETVFLLDEEGRVVSAPPRVKGLVGRCGDEIEGMRFSDLCANAEEAKDLLAQLGASDGPAYGTLNFRTPGGDEGACQVACFLKIETAAGYGVAAILKPLPEDSPCWMEELESLETRVERLQRTLGEMSCELTERTLQLAEERAKTLAVVTQMPSGLLVLDREGVVVQVNPVTCALFSVSERELLHRFLRDVLPDVAVALRQEERDSGSGGPQKAKCKLGDRTLQVLSHPIRGADGEEVIGKAVLLQDITQEEELARMREEIISIVSHELRSPMTTINGYLDIVLRGEAGTLNEKQNEFLEVAHGNGKRMARLINDLLDISRLEAGVARLKPGRLDAVYLLNFTYYNFLQQAEAGKIQLIKEEPEAPLYLRGDDERMLQVMTNLGSNAVKYTPEGGTVRLWVREEGHEVVIGVTDTGMGISEEDRKRLFTKFFRTREATLKKIGGAGLGLAITREIVKAHGGRMEVDSEPGKGSTFRVILPAWETRDAVGGV